MNASPDPQARPGWSSRRKLVVTLLSPLVGLAIGAVALEVHLRDSSTHLLGNPTASHGMYRVDAGGQYTLTPGWVGEHLVDEREVPVRIDADGLRADRPDRRLGPKAPGERRILLLGDSLVFGYGVDFDQTFGHVLELELEARTGQPWSVANAGTPGHGTWELARQFDHYAHLDPDLVIAGTSIGNDFTDDCFLDNDVVSGYLVTGAMARMTQSSWRVRTALRWRVAMFVERQLMQRAPSLALDLEGGEAVGGSEEALALFPPRPTWIGGLYSDRRADDAMVQHILATCETNYRALYERTGPLPVLHLFLPSIQQADPAEWAGLLGRQGFDPAEHERGRMIERLQALTRELGHPSVSVLERVDTEGPGTRDQWLVTDNHLSPVGNRDVGEWLVEPVLTLLAE